MAWRAMGSLLVLRSQANALAPLRSKASDGLIGDPAHQATNSDHNPHYVAGVGSEIVTALDLTHDPAHGFDSYRFAEALRRNRDRRVKYVISNHRIFSSYASGSRPAWAWGAYSGIDPHTGHVHVSVLDAVISDTTTPWNLEGFTMSDSVLTDQERLLLHNLGWLTQRGVIGQANPVVIPHDAGIPGSGASLVNELENTLNAIQAEQAAAKARDEKMAQDLAKLGSDLQTILNKLNQSGGPVLPATATFGPAPIIWG